MHITAWKNGNPVKDWDLGHYGDDQEARHALEQLVEYLNKHSLSRRYELSELGEPDPNRTMTYLQLDTCRIIWPGVENTNKVWIIKCDDAPSLSIPWPKELTFEEALTNWAWVVTTSGLR